MTQNMGLVDRWIRFAVVVIIAAAYLLGFMTAPWMLWVFGVIAAIMLATSIVGVCPLYALFGISTTQPTPKSR
jgi:membrane protein YdbS with pleckstrin-like domain